VLTTPLQKIITGGMLVAIAFVVSALVELKLEDTYPTPPEDEEGRVSYHNGLTDCSVNVIMDGFPEAIDDITLGRKEEKKETFSPLFMDCSLQLEKRYL